MALAVVQANFSHNLRAGTPDQFSSSATPVDFLISWHGHVCLILAAWRQHPQYPLVVTSQSRRVP